MSGDGGGRVKVDDPELEALVERFEGRIASVDRAAAILGVQPRTVLRLVDQGVLRMYVSAAGGGKPSRQVRRKLIPLEDLEAYLRRPRTQLRLKLRRMRRPARRLLLGLAVLASAAGGVVWYATAPGVGSYQLRFVLVLPGAIVALFWLHHRLPIWLQWSVALPLAIVGPAGYVIWGGSQWWNWGQATCVPLVLLVIAPRIKSGEPERPEPNYGGMMDGPWGPP